MFRVSVNSHTQDDCSDKRHYFIVNHSSGESWEIKKTVEEVVLLDSKLTVLHSTLPKLPEAPSSADIASYLTILSEKCQPSTLLQWKPLLLFLTDEAAFSRGSEICFLSLQEQVDALRLENAGYSAQISSLSDQYTQLCQMVAGLVSTGKCSSDATRTPCKPPLTPLAPPGFERGISTATEDSRGALSGTHSPLPEQPAASGNSWLNIVTVGRASPALVDQSPLITARTDGEREPEPEPVEVIRRAPNATDKAVDAILALLTPHESQVLYRSSVVGLLRKQCKMCLNYSSTFEIGLHAINCNLPDDPLLLTVVFSKNHAPNWCKNVLARVSQVVERCAAAGGYMAMKWDEPRFDWDDYKPLANHMLSNPHFVEMVTGAVPSVHLKTNYEVVNKVRCVVDALEVEIAPNSRSEVCLLSFLEEVAALVGQNDLFKRSVLLIRAWWVYETATYVGSVIKHYIPDNAMAVMIAMIFNLHHREISHPIDALAKMLTVFSKYDGFSEVITLQGIMPYAMQNKQQGINVSVSGSQLNLLPALESHLVTPALMDKYYRLFNCGLFPEVPSNPAKAPSPDMDTIGGGDVDSVHSEGGGGGSGAATAASAASGVVPKAPQQVSVERHGYNVMNPFSHCNLIADKMTTRRVVLIHKAFQVGVTNLALRLGTGPATKEGEAAPAPDIRLFFPACTGRFKENWRPDALGNSIELVNGTREVAALSQDWIREKLMNQALYCNFVLEGMVIDSVIVQITTEALETRGALAVGEIGKLLTEQSSIIHLSQKLKELFGGLKKLLERYKDQFMVAANHQFNPHVLLRSSLTHEQELQILSGVFPPELAKATRKQLARPVDDSQYGGQQHGGGGGGRQSSNSSYLNYNVNTSLDRRMRQQQMGNQVGPTAGGPKVGGQPRMASQPGGMGGAGGQHQFGRPGIKQQPTMMGGGGHHSQSSSMDLDWGDFSSSLLGPPGMAGGVSQPGYPGGGRGLQQGGLSNGATVGRAGGYSMPIGRGMMGGSGNPSPVVGGGSSLLSPGLVGSGPQTHRSTASNGSLANWLLQGDEDAEDHYTAAFQQPSQGGSTKAPGVQPSFEFDLDSEVAPASPSPYAGLWGEASSSILGSSFPPASELNVNASVFPSQFMSRSNR